MAVMLINIYSYSQISGIIRDGKTGKPIREATVFINGSSLSMLSSKDGRFELHNVPNGFSQLIIYKHGYELFKSTVNINPLKSFKLTLDLTAETLNEGSKKFIDNEQKVAVFKKYLFGSNQLLNLRNPKSIRFFDDLNGDKFLLTEPLIIENPLLGYRIYCYMSRMEKAAAMNQVLDNIRFEQTQSKELKVVQQWDANRTKSYWGSPRHFIKTLISGTLREEGFQVVDMAGNSVNIEGSFEKSHIPDYYHIKILDAIQVIYIGSDGDQRKWVLRPNGRIDATTDGLLVSPNSIVVQDETDGNKIDNLLPIDYDPLPTSSINTIRRFQEKIYIQTDKPYYYPKETIWMKGYLNYEELQLRDSLSSTVYVEFINDQNKILFSRTAKIEKGGFAGDIWLPDSIPAGDYNLRAYTNFMRNFSADAIFSKYVRVLNLTQWVDLKSPASLKSESAGLVITPDKPVYHTRDKVILSIALNDSTFTGDANVSIAVTDMDQVKPIEEVNILSPSFQFAKNPRFNKAGLKYPLEHGISITGRFFSGDARPDKTSLTVIQGKLENMKWVDTDAFGRFFVNGLTFYDNLDFSFQSLDKYGNLFGSVVISPREPPEINFFRPTPAEELKVEQATHEQRFFSDYELPKNTVLLKEVNVTAKKITPEKLEWGRRMFTPDNIIYAKDLPNVGNIVQSLETKLVGFGVQFNPNNGTYAIYNFRPLHSNPAPALLIDGIPSSIEMLNALPPQNVDRIETKSGVENLYGTAYNGVIAVYTKSYSNSDRPNKIQVIKLSGYSRPNDFRAPDYTASKSSASRDLRSTLYWNPNILLSSDKDDGPVSFFSSDQHGTYRVVVEGVAGNGKLLHAVTYIKIVK